jgi:hypothetical protein
VKMKMKMKDERRKQSIKIREISLNGEEYYM